MSHHSTGGYFLQSDSNDPIIKLKRELKECTSEEAVYAVSKNYIDSKLNDGKSITDKTITSLIEFGLIRKIM